MVLWLSFNVIYLKCILKQTDNVYKDNHSPANSFVVGIAADTHIES